ncbi:ORF126 [Ranid herpesvirus 2]|uniref:ORF126 n=1 Tax=Ranid herpesvirus 2 TaxID=389214 RepID=Q14VY0_9VIRU|nr:ORF126 [Ranid herpesvirus 2]ABG25574.1 ORF126 [Ranid herpesvirus 2]
MVNTAVSSILLADDIAKIINSFFDYCDQNSTSLPTAINEFQSFFVNYKQFMLNMRNEYNCLETNFGTMTSIYARTAYLHKYFDIVIAKIDALKASVNLRETDDFYAHAAEALKERQTLGMGVVAVAKTLRVDSVRHLTTISTELNKFLTFVSPAKWMSEGFMLPTALNLPDCFEQNGVVKYEGNETMPDFTSVEMWSKNRTAKLELILDSPLKGEMKFAIEVGNAMDMFEKDLTTTLNSVGMPKVTALANLRKEISAIVDTIKKKNLDRMNEMNPLEVTHKPIPMQFKSASSKLKESDYKKHLKSPKIKPPAFTETVQQISADVLSCLNKHNDGNVAGMLGILNSTLHSYSIACNAALERSTSQIKEFRQKLKNGFFLISTGDWNEVNASYAAMLQEFGTVARRSVHVDDMKNLYVEIHKEFDKYLKLLKDFESQLQRFGSHDSKDTLIEIGPITTGFARYNDHVKGLAQTFTVWKTHQTQQVLNVNIAKRAVEDERQKLSDQLQQLLTNNDSYAAASAKDKEMYDTERTRSQALIQQHADLVRDLERKLKEEQDSATKKDSDFTNLNRELNTEKFNARALQNAVQQKDIDLNNARTTLSAAEARVVQLEAENTRLETEIETQRRQAVTAVPSQTITDQLQDTLRQLTEERQEILRINREHDDAKREIGALRHKITDLTAAMTTLQAAANSSQRDATAKFAADIQNEQARTSQKHVRKEHYKRAAQQARTELADLQTEMATKESEITSLNSQITTLTQEKDTAQRSATQKDGQINDLTTQLADAQATYRTEEGKLRSKILDLDTKVAGCELQISQLGTDLAAAQSEKTDLQKKYDDLSEEFQKSNKTCTVVNTALQKSDGELQKAKRELQEHKDKLKEGLTLSERQTAEMDAKEKQIAELERERDVFRQFFVITSHRVDVYEHFFANAIWSDTEKKDEMAQALCRHMETADMYAKQQELFYVQLHLKLITADTTANDIKSLLVSKEDSLKQEITQIVADADYSLSELVTVTYHLLKMPLNELVESILWDRALSNIKSKLWEAFKKNQSQEPQNLYAVAMETTVDEAPQSSTAADQPADLMTIDIVRSVKVDDPLRCFIAKNQYNARKGKQSADYTRLQRTINVAYANMSRQHASADTHHSTHDKLDILLSSYSSEDVAISSLTSSNLTSTFQIPSTYTDLKATISDCVVSRPQSRTENFIAYLNEPAGGTVCDAMKAWINALGTNPPMLDSIIMIGVLLAACGNTNLPRPVVPSATEDGDETGKRRPAKSRNLKRKKVGDEEDNEEGSSDSTGRGQLSEFDSSLRLMLQHRIMLHQFRETEVECWLRNVRPEGKIYKNYNKYMNRSLWHQEVDPTEHAAELSDTSLSIPTVKLQQFSEALNKYTKEVKKFGIDAGLEEWKAHILEYKKLLRTLEEFNLQKSICYRSLEVDGQGLAIPARTDDMPRTAFYYFTCAQSCVLQASKVNGEESDMCTQIFEEILFKPKYKHAAQVLYGSYIYTSMYSKKFSLVKEYLVAANLLNKYKITNVTLNMVSNYIAEAEFFTFAGPNMLEDTDYAGLMRKQNLMRDMYLKHNSDTGVKVGNDLTKIGSDILSVQTKIKCYTQENFLTFIRTHTAVVACSQMESVHNTFTLKLITFLSFRGHRRALIFGSNSLESFLLESIHLNANGVLSTPARFWWYREIPDFVIFCLQYTQGEVLAVLRDQTLHLISAYNISEADGYVWSLKDRLAIYLNINIKKVKSHKCKSTGFSLLVYYMTNVLEDGKSPVNYVEICRKIISEDIALPTPSSYVDHTPAYVLASYLAVETASTPAVDSDVSGSEKEENIDVADIGAAVGLNLFYKADEAGGADASAVEMADEYGIKEELLDVLEEQSEPDDDPIHEDKEPESDVRHAKDSESDVRPAKKNTHRKVKKTPKRGEPKERNRDRSPLRS